MMPGFIGHLRVEQLTEAAGDANATWRLLEPFGFESADYPGIVIQAPAGFVTDFASVPRVPIAFEVCGDIAQDCATLHDFMYSTGCVSRLLADVLLREMMRLRGFTPLQLDAIYSAVRLFGAPHYTEESS